MKFQIRNVRKFIAKFVGIILRNWGGQSIWGLGSIVRMKRESKKLRRNNVENVDAGECLNCTGEKMQHAIFAWGIGKAGLEKILRKLGSWIRTTGINIRRRKRCIIRNIVRGKLNAKCVSVRLGNVIGQDIWWVGSICWGAVVEKLVVMGGVGEDEMKGKHVLLTTDKHNIWNQRNAWKSGHRRDTIAMKWMWMFLPYHVLKASQLAKQL